MASTLLGSDTGLGIRERPEEAVEALEVPSELRVRLELPRWQLVQQLWQPWCISSSCCCCCCRKICWWWCCCWRYAGEA